MGPRVFQALALIVAVSSALLAATLAGFVYAFTWNDQGAGNSLMIGLLVAAAVVGAAGGLTAPFRPRIARWPLVAAAALVLPTMAIAEEWAPGTPALGFVAAALLAGQASKSASPRPAKA